MADLPGRATEREYVREAEALLRRSPPKLSALTVRLLEQAEAEARARDDNHVGTEHLVLGLYALGETTARRTLEALGISRQVFADQLECEAGPSPSGAIPLTPRARMTIGLAGAEAARTASGEAQPEHLLLGVIRESEKWQASGQAGPHHLRAAAEAVGASANRPLPPVHSKVTVAVKVARSTVPVKETRRRSPLSASRSASPST